MTSKIIPSLIWTDAPSINDPSENSRIAKPSPNILYVLAGVYAASYEDLMKRAGYFTSDAKAAGRRQAKAGTFAIRGLTPEEETILIDYLAFIRKQKRK